MDNKCSLENVKIARFTGRAIQDDETYKSEGGFVPERDQYYFEMKQGDNAFLIGFKDLLTSLRLLEKMKEIPPIGEKWWLQMATLYGNDIIKVEDDYVREYVPETEEPQRRKIYKIAKECFDKAIYVLQKETGIYITLNMAEQLAENYAMMRAYNYIDATIYNIPWYLIYSFNGFPLYHMMIKKDTTLHKHLKQLGLKIKNSKISGYVYVENNEGYLLTATDYRYVVDENSNLNESLLFSIICPDDAVTNTLLYKLIDRISVKVDSNYFNNLLDYQDWKPQQKLLDIAKKYMNP